MTPARALADVLELNLTQDNYLKLRSQAIEHNADIFPAYNKVQEMKKLCLPNNIVYKDDEVVMTLQDAVNHQILRLCHLNPSMVDEMQRLKDEFGAKILFSYKFGGG